MDSEYSALSEVCELIVDCPHSTPEWTDHGIVVLRNQNIRDGRLDLANPSYTNQNDYEKRIKRAAPQAGDIVITREAPMGEVCMIPEGLKCCLGQRQVLLRPSKSINGHYLYWALQSPFVKHQIAWNEGTGTTVSNIRIPVLEALKIPRNFGSEEKIGKILTSISQKIEICDQTNQTLEEMAQAIFKSWFVDFDPVKAKAHVIAQGGSEQDANLAAMEVISGKTRDQLAALQKINPEHYTQLHTTATLFPSAFVDSELGEIPEGWEVNCIENISTLTSDRMNSAELNRENYISTENMLENKRGITTASNYPSEGKVPAFLVKDTLISNIRPYFKKIWFAAFEGGRSPDVLGFRAKNFELAEFLYNLLYQDRFFDHMMKTSKGVKMPRGDKEAIMQWKFVMPTREIATQYSKLTANIYKRVHASTKQSDSLKNIRDLVLPELLSGSIQL